MLMVVNDTYVMDSFPALFFQAYIAVKKGGEVALIYGVFLSYMMWIK